MSLQVERLEGSMAKLTIELEASEVDRALQAAYIKERKNISLPGFRKGKVPRQMIEKMYGPEIFYDEAANQLIQTSYGNAYDESGLEIVSQPKVEVVQLEKGKPFIYTAEVAVKPEVKLGQYKGLTVDKVSLDVTEDEIEAEINKELEKSARTVDVNDRPVQSGDMIKLDFEGFVDDVAFEGGKGEDFALTIGSGSFIPGFEDQLIGAVIGMPIDVNVEFPVEYQAAELAGKPALFKCKVNSIQAKELPVLDDEFAAEVSEFETVAEYRDSVKASILERKEKQAKEQVENQAVDKAIENAEMDIPEPMIAMEVRQMTDDFARRMQQQGLSMEQYFQFTGLTQERMLEDMKPQALKRIQTRLLLEEISKVEDIQVTEERLQEELQKMATTYNMELDKVKEIMGETETARMKEDLAVQEAITLLADTAVQV